MVHLVDELNVSVHRNCTDIFEWIAKVVVTVFAAVDGNVKGFVAHKNVELEIFA
jgi:hypothetical protein